MKEIPKQDTNDVSGGGSGDEQIDYAPLPETDYPRCPAPAVFPEPSRDLR
jgi:hypothetical protein